MKDFASKDGYWTWEALEKLGKALGYHPKVFFDHIPASQTSTPNSGLRVEDLMLLLQSDLLYPIFHKTFNHQDGSYNLKVIIKALNLLQKKYISFSQLNKARVSFQTYENTDHAGLEDKHVLRAFKLCDMVMAPQRLKLLLQRMDRLVADRIMLYEFLDLVSSAESLNNVEKELSSNHEYSGKLDKRGLYELCDFREELVTHDDRCLNHLDKQFKEMLKVIPVAKKKVKGDPIDDIKLWATPPLVNKTVRKNMTKVSRMESHCLNEHLKESVDSIQDSNHGNRCQCCSSVDVEWKELEVNISNEDDDDVERNRSRNDKGNCKQRTSASLLVTEQDKEETIQKIQNLQWHLATKRYKKKTNKSHDSILTTDEDTIEEDDTL